MNTGRPNLSTMEFEVKDYSEALDNLEDNSKKKKMIMGGLVLLALTIGVIAILAVTGKSKDEIPEGIFQEICLAELEWKNERPDLKESGEIYARKFDKTIKINGFSFLYETDPPLKTT
jgi:hypothetical protein